MAKRRNSLLAGVFFAALSHVGAHAQTLSFADWLASFKLDAVAAGVSPAVFDAAFEGVSVDPKVFEQNDNQPEFTRSIWSYLDSAVSQSRRTNGTAKLAENNALLAEIEAAYGVDREIIVAIWGLESAYGAILGDHYTIEALATLAYQGRRTAFGRQQLIGALKIIENGYASQDQLKGSWAGAMGHTQFIPTTYLSYAVDHDGDGRRNIWSDLGDVFSSTANYLSASGYRNDQPWGVEVTLPDGFDYSQAAPGKRKPLAVWASLGVDAARGSLLGVHDPNARGRIIVPAGAAGPAFIVFENFEAILKYNRATSYALAVGLLSEAVAGRPSATVQSWPRDDRMLSKAERKQLQRTLAAQGFNPGPADGVIGANTKKALRAWQAANGVAADGYASAAVLSRLLAATAAN